MMLVVRVLVHVAWIVPFVLGRPYLAIAMLLFVGLCYIKVFKFRQQIADLAERGAPSSEEAAVRRALQRWQSLTWLKNS